MKEANHPDEPSALGGLEEEERAWKALTPEMVAARAWEQGNTQPLRAGALGSEAEYVS